MKKATTTLIAIALALATASAYAEDGGAATAQSPSEVQAPFGLEWGMLKTQLSAMTCRASAKLVGLTNCSTKQVPRPLSDAEVYHLTFDKTDGLIKVQYASTDITGDPRGTAGKGRFDDLRAALSSKYPSAKKDEFIWTGGYLYDEFGEFYQCLKYGDKCGSHSLYIQPGKGVIVIELKGIRRGVGFIRMAYESPEFGAAFDRAKSAKNNLDAGAL